MEEAKKAGKRNGVTAYVPTTTGSRKSPTALITRGVTATWKERTTRSRP